MGAPRTFFPRSLGSWKKLPVEKTNKQTKKQSGSLVYVGCVYNSATYNNNIDERITRC